MPVPSKLYSVGMAATALHCLISAAQRSETIIDKPKSLLSSVVGYVKREVVRNSYNMLAIQFQDPGSIVEAGDITKAITTDLPCLDYCDYGTADMPNILIKTKDTDAEYAKSFYYMCDSEYEEIGPDQFEVLPNGWYTAEEEPPTASDLIQLGRGFWLIIPNDEELYPNDKYTVTFNGQVATMTKPLSVPVVNNGYIMMANPFPVALDFNNMITPSAGVPCLDYVDYGIDEMPNILIKTKDTDAEYAKSFYYMCDSEYEEIGPDQFEVLPNGWYTAEEEEPTAADFVKPGNSFWVIIPDGCLPDDKQTFTFSMN